MEDLDVHKMSVNTLAVVYQTDQEDIIDGTLHTRDLASPLREANKK